MRVKAKEHFNNSFQLMVIQVEQDTPNVVKMRQSNAI